MEAIDAQQYFLSSLGGVVSSTPHPRDVPRSEYLREERRKLEALGVAPFQVDAEPCQWAVEHLGLPAKAFKMFVVAGSNRHWLLVEPRSRDFYLAEGRPSEDGVLSLVGFSSKDPLAEWLG